jgi:hypothetical protein
MPGDFFKDPQHVERGQLTHGRMAPYLTPMRGRFIVFGDGFVGRI